MDEGQKRKGLILEDCLGQVLMPGDEFQKPPLDKAALGPGLKLLPAYEGVRDKETIIVCKAGILTKKRNNVYFMELRRRNYSAYRKDDVVGVIKKKQGEQFIIDIGTKDRVILQKSNFEGATKKYRPDHKIGDCIFGKFVELPSDFPLEMSCVNKAGKSVGQGLLSDGYLLRLPDHMIRILRDSSPKVNFLGKVGQIVPVEIVPGANGYVWLETKKLLTSVLLCRLLQTASSLPQENHAELIRVFRDAVSGWA